MAKNETFLAPLARTTSAALVSETKDSSGYREFVLCIPVSAKSGTTPTLDLKIQDSVDAVKWFDLFEVPQITAVGNYAYRIAVPFMPKLRAVYTIAGTTPVFTFECFAHLKTREAIV